jgi:hypothetical protein
MKLYTVVIHYLQMCMKEYSCCPQFGRGDTLTYTLKLPPDCNTMMFKPYSSMHICRQCITTVKFHLNPMSCLGGVAEIGTCCFYAKHGALKSNIQNCLA